MTEERATIAITETTFVFESNGSAMSMALRHPVCAAGRLKAIRALLAEGSSIVPDIENVPSWLRGAPPPLQEVIYREHVELVNIYKITVAHDSKFASALDWLKYLTEVKYLALSYGVTRAESFNCLLLLTQLEILVIRGLSITEVDALHFPYVASLKMLDVQDSDVSHSAAEILKSKFSGAKVYTNSL